MRFTTPARKALVVAVLLAVNVALALLFDALHSEVASIVLTVLQLAGWYLATRVFRGPGESVSAARPWWRMTNRPLLSGVFGAGYALLAVVNIGFSFAGYGSLSGTVSIVAELVLAALFLNCYACLRPRRSAPAEPGARQRARPRVTGGFSLNCTTWPPSTSTSPKRPGGCMTVTVPILPWERWKASSRLRSTSATRSRRSWRPGWCCWRSEWRSGGWPVSRRRSGRRGRCAGVSSGASVWRSRRPSPGRALGHGSIWPAA